MKLWIYTMDFDDDKVCTTYKGIVPSDMAQTTPTNTTVNKKLKMVDNCEASLERFSTEIHSVSSEKYSDVVISVEDTQSTVNNSPLNESIESVLYEKSTNDENSIDDSFDLFLPNKFGKNINSTNFKNSQGTDGESTGRSINMKSSFFENSPLVEDFKKLGASHMQGQCPVCLIKCKNLDFHLKTCVKKNKVSKQKLGIAWDLLEKQTKERFDLGLPTLAFKTSNDKVFEREIKEAIAMSLETISDKSVEELATGGSEIFTLKKLETKVSGKNSKQSGKPLLLRRTKEERQNIITEKVAIVLMDSDSSDNKETNFINSDFDLKSSILKNLLCQEALLWKKSSSPPSDVKPDDFYTPSMSLFTENGIKSEKEPFGNTLEFQNDHIHVKRRGLNKIFDDY